MDFGLDFEGCGGDGWICVKRGLRGLVWFGEEMEGGMWLGDWNVGGGVWEEFGVGNEEWGRM